MEDANTAALAERTLGNDVDAGDTIGKTETSLSSTFLQPGQDDEWSHAQAVALRTENAPHIGVKSASTTGHINVTLENENIWSRFHSIGTEMILTKQGRRMFPCCRFRLRGLDPNLRFFLVMDVMPLDDFRHKWNGTSWEVGGTSEPHIQGPVCLHPESPALGRHWMDGPVSFYKVKLAHNSLDQDGCLVLHPMQRYQPRLYVVPVSAGHERAIQLESPDVHMFTFPQTEFYAVTSYQNPRITQLKIECNPFTLAFRVNGQNSRRLHNKLKLALTGRTQTQLPVPSHATHTCNETSENEDLSSTHTHPESESDREENIVSDRKRVCDQTSSCEEEQVTKRFMRDESQPHEHVKPTEHTMPHEMPPSSSEPHCLTSLTESLERDSVDVFGPPNGIPSTLSPLSASCKPKRAYCRSNRWRKARKAKSKWWTNVKYAKPPDVMRPVDVSMQPDLEDVDGMLFVSFTAKEALDNHVGNTRNPVESSSSSNTENQTQMLQSCSEDVSLTVQEKISNHELMLLEHLKQVKNRQIIHPVLQQVGMKLNLLDPAVPIDLQYLGVFVPLLSLVHSGAENLTSSPNAPFVSRTGKTNDPIRIKGWREKFTSTTVQNSTESSGNHSAFFSDMLDEYLETEAQQISERAAVFSTSAPSPVAYQLPAKSSSYVRTLNSVLQTRSIQPNSPHSGIHRKLTNMLPSKSSVKTTPGNIRTSSSRPQQSTPLTVGKRLRRSTSCHSFQYYSTISTSKTTNPSYVYKRRVGRPRKHPLKLNIPCLEVRGCSDGGEQSSSTSAESHTEMLLQEQEAVFHGNSRTCVTTERAKFALNSLVTLEKRETAPFSTSHVYEDGCGNDFCRLGCICNSLYRKLRGDTHCRRVQCMFGCSCFKHKVFLIRPPDVSEMLNGRRMPLIAYPIADPELEPRPEPAPRVTKLWKRTPKDFDSEPIFIPKQVPVRKEKPRLHTYTPRPNPQVLEKDKDPVYKYLESKMTCARVREYNSNPPPQVHLFPVKKNVRGSGEAFNEESSLHPARGHVTSQSTGKNSTDVPEPTKVLEILSECNWEARRSLVLKQLFQYIDMNHHASTFFIDTYKVQLLSTEFKNHGANSMLIYKVCVSLGEKSGATGKPNPEKNKCQITEEPLPFRNSSVQLVNTLVSNHSNNNLGIINFNMATKTPERFPLISRILPAGYLKADKKTSVHPGQIKVNDKTYSQAKLLLGEMGALHPANRLAAYVTGRLKPLHQNQIKSRLVSETLKTLPFRTPADIKEKLRETSRSNPAEQTGPTNQRIEAFITPAAKPSVMPKAPSGTNCTSAKMPDSQAKLLLGQRGTLHPTKRPAVNINGRLKPMHQNQNMRRWILNPAPPTDSITIPTQTLTANYKTSNTGQVPNIAPISVPTPNAGTAPPSTPDTVLPAAALPPGQQVVLQPVAGMTGVNLCQFNGQTIQLVPIPEPLQSQTSSDSKGSTQQKPQTAPGLPQAIPQEAAPSHKAFAKLLPFNAPKILSATGKTSFTFVNGATAQSGFAGKAGTFSFRICPPSGDGKAMGHDQTGTPPVAGAASTLLLPGGYRLIKLPINPCVNFINSESTPPASVPPGSQPIDNCTEKPIQSAKESSKDCGSTSSPVPESNTNDPTQIDAVRSSMALPSSEGAHEQVSTLYSHETVSNAEIKSDNSAKTGGNDWIPEDVSSERMLKNDDRDRKLAEEDTFKKWPPKGAQLVLWEDEEEHENDNSTSIGTEPSFEQNDQPIESSSTSHGRKEDCEPTQTNIARFNHAEVPNEGPTRHESSGPIKTEPSDNPPESLTSSAPNTPDLGPPVGLKIEAYSGSKHTETLSKPHDMTCKSNSDPVIKSEYVNNPPNTCTLFCNAPENTKHYIKVEPYDKTSEMDQFPHHPDITDTAQNPKTNTLVPEDSLSSYPNMDEPVQDPDNDLLILKVEEVDNDPSKYSPVHSPGETLNDPGQANKSSPISDAQFPIDGESELDIGRDFSSPLFEGLTSVSGLRVASSTPRCTKIPSLCIHAKQLPQNKQNTLAHRFGTHVNNCDAVTRGAKQRDKPGAGLLEEAEFWNHLKWPFGGKALNSGCKDIEGDPSDGSVDELLSSFEDSSNAFMCSSDSCTTEDSDDWYSDKDIDIERFEENDENICRLRAKARRKAKKAALHRWLNSRMDYHPVERMSDLPLYKRTRHLNHTARKRKHQDELQQCFDSLKMALNVEDRDEINDQHILTQARQMIEALEERSRSLMEKKRALTEKHSHYHALISQLSGSALQQKTRCPSSPQTTPETAASNQSVANKPLRLPSIVLMSFNQI
ncbi:MAX gene-associated protein [Xyrauchen texanus]|uniref:MAX gene-associated protein n=1 Tax=Xyrauchen texanus TaxID=154827 RepID=UPI002241E98C|nr:MAX gene-associated protein [Xyrauchen texanus]